MANSMESILFWVKSGPYTSVVYELCYEWENTDTIKCMESQSSGLNAY